MIWFDIVLFAGVAAFLGWRLYLALGERHGDERSRQNPYDLEAIRREREKSESASSRPSPVDAPKAVDDQQDEDKVVPLHPTNGGLPVMKHAPDSLAGRLAAIEEADPRFDEKSFVAGAKNAFGMIVTAFAAEDTATLRPLLSDDVYDSFAEAIRQRKAAGEKLETRIVRIVDADIEDASLSLNTARVTVRLVSEQVQVVRNVAGDVLSGDQKHPVSVVDLWTFTRNTRASDPNWFLAETRSGE